MKERIKQFFTILVAIIVAFFFCDSFVQERNKRREAEKEQAESQAQIDRLNRQTQRMRDDEKFLEDILHANSPAEIHEVVKRDLHIDESSFKHPAEQLLKK